MNTDKLKDVLSDLPELKAQICEYKLHIFYAGRRVGVLKMESAEETYFEALVFRGAGFDVRRVVEREGRTL
jgi:hypothetical protein